MDEHDPTLRGEHLGDELKKLRTDAHLTLADAAKHIGALAPKLSKMEHGKQGFRFEDVAGLLSVYRVIGKQRDELLTIAREADQRGWILRSDHEQTVSTLRRIEAKATEIVNYETQFVPGLLQTIPYSLALFKEVVGLSNDKADDWMAKRVRRQSVLRYPSQTIFTALIAEDVLRHRIGGPAVLREQLKYMIEVATRPKIGIRIVPTADRGHPGLNGPFARFHLPDRGGVVCLENATFSIFLEEKADIEHYDGFIEQLLATALSEQDSVLLLASVVDELEGDAST